MLYVYPSREVPRELVRQAKGGEVNLNMEDHRQEDFVVPKVKVKAFSGAGNMLGRQVVNSAVHRNFGRRVGVK